MYQQLCEFFQSMPFFSSAAFGIFAMLCYGSSWSLIGLFLGNAPKKGFEAAVMIVVSNVVMLIFSIVTLIATKAYSTADLLPTLFTCGAFAASGVLIFIQQKIMSVAMQSGPNGVIWAIIQSALICPFLMGFCFFKSEVNLMQWLGLFFLIGALVLFACGKDNHSKGGRLWKYLAFTGFAVTGVQQSLNLIPSYYPATFGVTSVLKAIAQSGGIMLAFAVWMLFQDRRKNFQDIKAALSNCTFWKYIAILQCTNILIMYFLFYPGLNVMVSAGLGSICYPMMVGACIVAFTMISLMVLKEKINRIQIAALAGCLGGLVLMCL
ncbi:MAG: hypothetical protein IKB71_02655 [Lentisphaeria bacterium]|nr:hypothetical protein [Lentisphaeria bacterium]